MIEPAFLNGKKILLTSFSYALFGGAELNPVELAEELSRFGAKVYFFSYDIDGPLTEYINKKFKTKVLTDTAYYLAESVDELNSIQFDISDYDYIWVGANVIPISIIRQINTAKKMPKFIFIHMSALPAYPLDAPLLPEFEKKIASRILSIGEKTSTNCIFRILGKNIPLGGWKNPVPRDFKLLKSRDGKLRNIAVISSSHPSEEIINIKSLIKKYAINIDYIGRFNDNVQVVDANFYDKYDLIIGIGKNARYSLVSGVPIYVYGRFGGSGYVNEENYNINDSNNFSGRGFDKKTSQQITKEIVNGYEHALEYHSKNRERFINDFSIDIVSEKLFRELEKESSKKVKFSEEYINWLVSMQINFMQRLQTSSDVRNLHSHIRQLESDLMSSNAESGNIHGIKKSARLFLRNIKTRIAQEFHKVIEK